MLGFTALGSESRNSSSAVHCLTCSSGTAHSLQQCKVPDNPVDLRLEEPSSIHTKVPPITNHVEGFS